MQSSNYNIAVELIKTMRPGEEFIDGYFFTYKTLAKKLGLSYKESKSIALKLLADKHIHKDSRDGVYIVG